MSDPQLTDAQIIAAGLVDTCRLTIAGGADPAAVMDGCLILMAQVVRDHLDPEQAPEFADWLRQWADHLEGKGDAPRRH